MGVTRDALVGVAVTAALALGATVAYHHVQELRVAYCRAECLQALRAGPLRLLDVRTYIHRRVHTGWVYNRWDASIGEIVYRQLADFVACKAVDEIRNHHPGDDGFTEDPADAEDATAAGPSVRSEPDRPFVSVRRGGRRNAAFTVYYLCVKELGRNQFSMAMKLTVENVARREMVKLNVRPQDFPRLLADVVRIYFTPTPEELETAALLKSAVVRDQWNEIHGLK